MVAEKPLLGWKAAPWVEPLSADKPYNPQAELVSKSETQWIKNNFGIHLTNVFLFHLQNDTLESLPSDPSQITFDPDFHYNVTGLVNMGNLKERRSFLMEVFIPPLAKGWNYEVRQSSSEQEKKAAIACTELRDKGYSLRRLMEEACKHFNLPLGEALEIAKKDYFIISDLAKDLGMNLGSTRNRTMEALRNNPGIKTERLAGKQIFVHNSERDNLKSLIESLTQRTVVTLPDDKKLAISGRLKGAILKMLLDQENIESGLPLEKILSLYPGLNRKLEREEAHHVISDLKRELNSFGWTVKNLYLRRKTQISTYFLKKYEATSKKSEKAEAPIIIFEQKDIKPKDVTPGLDPLSYSTPKGEKAFWNPSDIAVDFGVEKSDVTKALERLGIKVQKGTPSQGGKKGKLQLSYAEYQIIKNALQQEVKRKKKEKKKTTFSPVTVFRVD